MGGYKTWAALEEVTAANMNTYVRDNTVPQFASAAARSAAIAAPVVGTMSYLTDTGSLEVYYGATTGWRPPWSTRWGLIDRKILSAGVGYQTVVGTTMTTASDGTTSASITFTPVANRVYRFHFSPVVQVQGTTANVIGKFYKGSSTVIGWWAAETLTNNAIAKPGGVLYTADCGSTSDTFTAKFALESGGSTAVCYWGTDRPAVFSIEDVGPTGSAPVA